MRVRRIEYGYWRRGQGCGGLVVGKVGLHQIPLGEAQGSWEDDEGKEGGRGGRRVERRKKREERRAGEGRRGPARPNTSSSRTKKIGEKR